jgi:hypothetical protein
MLEMEGVANTQMRHSALPFPPEANSYLREASLDSLQPQMARSEGRRLDAEAAPLRARIPEGYGEIGFQSTYVIFPTPGCWEVTGRVDNIALRSVVWIIKVREGPTWQQNY